MSHFAREVFVFAVLAAALWLAGCLPQRVGPGAYTFRPPVLLLYLCGKPRCDGTLDLNWATWQCQGAIFFIGGVAGSLLAANPLVILLALVMVCFVFNQVMRVVGKRHERQRRRPNTKL
jgi:hypothetical protein